MEVTNKTLGLLLIAAIVVSLGGTFVSLNRLGGVSTTGYATNNQTGTVNLTVDSALSIVVNDNNINFGSCTPANYPIVLDSNASSGAANNTFCSSGVFPDKLIVENDGNTDANVTVRSTHNGTTLFDTSTGGLAYKIGNGTNPGCYGTMQASYLNFTITNGTDSTYKNPGCSNLSFNDANDEIQLFAQIVLPPSTTSANTATIQFEAEPSTG